MIGTINLTLNKETDVNSFIQNIIAKEYVLNDEIRVNGNGLSIEYDDKYTDNAEALFNREEVVEAFGEFHDDGYKSDMPNDFAMIKKNGKVEYESPIYLSQLSDIE